MTNFPLPPGRRIVMTPEIAAIAQQSLQSVQQIVEDAEAKTSDLRKELADLNAQRDALGLKIAELYQQIRDIEGPEVDVARQTIAAVSAVLGSS